MSIGIGQILLIVVVGVLLFGNFSGVLKDLAGGINVFKETLNQDQKKDSEQKGSETTTSAPESASKETSSEESEARKGFKG